MRLLRAGNNAVALDIVATASPGAPQLRMASDADQMALVPAARADGRRALVVALLANFERDFPQSRFLARVPALRGVRATGALAVPPAADAAGAAAAALPVRSARPYSATNWSWRFPCCGDGLRPCSSRCSCPSSRCALRKPRPPGTAPRRRRPTPGWKPCARSCVRCTGCRDSATVDATANSKLELPGGYVFLNAADTKKFNELNENLGTDKEVMFAPEDLHWSAFLTFDDEGYVKDDEKIDAPALLKALQENTEAANEERKRRGWGALHIVGWSQEPKYNATTKRLEWATLLRSDNGEGINYFTKILGRRGVTTVVLAAAPGDLADASASLNATLEGYTFNPGHTYAEWVPGDKVAEYGLAGLIIGGGAAAAAKAGLLKGLWVHRRGLAAGWKLIVVAAVAVAGFFRRLFGRKDREADRTDHGAVARRRSGARLPARFDALPVPRRGRAARAAAASPRCRSARARSSAGAGRSCRTRSRRTGRSSGCSSNSPRRPLPRRRRPTSMRRCAQRSPRSPRPRPVGGLRAPLGRRGARRAARRKRHRVPPRRGLRLAADAGGRRPGAARPRRARPRHGRSPRHGRDRA
ncbi:MAG: DUF2167 domain-containing protein [Steroidobacteraceae bacterium]